MINLDDVTKENIKEHNPNWLQIHDHAHKILITGGSGSGKINSLFILMRYESDKKYIKIHLYTKDSYETKYQFLINKQESTGLKNDSKAFIENSNDMDDIYKNIEEYNPNKKPNIIAHILSNKKLYPIVT